MIVLQGYIDGASRGNPGHAGIGVVLIGDDGVVAELSEPIGIATNNEAEYRALVACLECAQRHGARRLTVLADSQLVVLQMVGQYAVRHERLREFHLLARERMRYFEEVQFVHIPRTQNTRADALARAAARKSQETRLIEENTGFGVRGSGFGNQQGAKQEAGSATNRRKHGVRDSGFGVREPSRKPSAKGGQR